MSVKGIDISYCQNGIDYQALKKAGVKFAIIRAGASERTDNLLETHVKGCQKNGIDYGFYWYCYAMGVAEVKKEAAACLKAIAKYAKPDYPVFFDMEEQAQISGLNSKLRTDMAIEFCKAIEKGGYPCGIYANPAWLENYYEKSRLVGKYDIWLAHWTDSPNKPSKYNYGQTMWQWGVDRIGMDVDGDVSFIDYPAKTAKWYKEHGGTNKTEQSDKNTDKTNKTDQNDVLKKGVEITLKNAPLYGASTSKSKAATVNGTYWIHSDGIINSRIRITKPKGCADCTGWVNVRDVKVVTATTNKPQKTTFKVGDKVKVKVGAKTYNGGGLAPFVYTLIYDVMQVGISGKPDYIVIGQNGDITAAIHDYDLIKK